MTRDKTDLPGTGRTGRGPVSFGERMAGSDNFLALFRDGMGLLEETADYLDGPGRSDSRMLDRLGGLAYATESMKLTTRLMQVASWLLLQRAVNEGEMSSAQAAEEKGKVRLEHPEDRERANGYADLPEGLKGLIERSLRMQARVRHLDRQLRGGDAPQASDTSHPVFAQIDKVRSAFGSPDA
jgi:regulator of CtrA degradation